VFRASVVEFSAFDHGPVPTLLHRLLNRNFSCPPQNLHNQIENGYSDENKANRSQFGFCLLKLLSFGFCKEPWRTQKKHSNNSRDENIDVAHINDPGSAAAATGRVNCNRDAMPMAACQCCAAGTWSGVSLHCQGLYRTISVTFSPAFLNVK